MKKKKTQFNETENRRYAGNYGPQRSEKLMKIMSLGKNDKDVQECARVISGTRERIYLQFFCFFLTINLDDCGVHVRLNSIYNMKTQNI